MSDVRWRRSSSDVWAPLVPVPARNGGFFEATSYLIEKPCADCVFYVDDELLADAPDAGSWIWEPRFFAGQVRAEMVRGDRQVESFGLDVSPDPRKVGDELFARMVRDLWREDPRFVMGAEPATTPNGDLHTGEDPWAAFARYREYAPAALRAIGPIRARPRRTLLVRRESVTVSRVRRVDRRTALSSIGTPAGRFFATADSDCGPLPEGLVDVPAMEETVDCAANRAVKAGLLALRRRALALIEALGAAVDHEQKSETRTALATRWPRRKMFLENVANRLVLTLRQSPFREVHRAEVTAAGLTAIATDPAYSRAWSQSWRALRHGFAGELDAERLWISPSWQIYERWCFLRFGQMLCEELPSWNWQRCGIKYWQGSMGVRRAELTLQPKFPARRAENEAFWSISKQREPDLMLTLTEGDRRRFLVLDAKYRATRENVLDAMESAHLYQDSLRLGPHRPAASLLLVPSSAEVGWLERAEFHAEHRVGVHQLAPGIAARLPDLVIQFLT